MINLQGRADPVCRDIHPRHGEADGSKVLLVETVTSFDRSIPIIATIEGR